MRSGWETAQGLLGCWQHSAPGQGAKRSVPFVVIGVLCTCTLYCSEKLLLKSINEHITVIGAFWRPCDVRDINWALKGPGSSRYLPGLRHCVTLGER